ncbi:MAG TPA: glucose-1-phosphate thymidylyltransferase [Streptosporangiaceae bacterium]
MKGLVLAGGSGTRLRPITYTSPKQLVPVGNRPILFYGLDALAGAGIAEVGIVVGDTAPEIMAAVGDGAAFGLDVTYIRQDEPRGLAHAVLVSRDFLGDEDFVMYLGDNFVAGGVAPAVGEFRRTGPDAQILLAPVPDPAAFGVAELGPDGRVVALEEKPEHPKSDLAVVGVYLFGPAVHEAVRAIRPSARGELEITHAIQWLIDAGRDVRSGFVPGYWKDTGRVADVLDVNRCVLGSIEPRGHGKVDERSEIVGRVQIFDGAEVRGSRIVGPAIIGAGSVVTGSYVGPFTSVAENCRIDRSEIEFSIVLRNSRISGVGRITASLIGRDVVITPGAAAPAAHRLVLGDHSEVQICQ